MHQVRPAILVLVLCLPAIAVAQEPALPTEVDHPDGETPAQRMLTLAHTDALPRFDRADIFAVTLPAPFSDQKPKNERAARTFPVRPYGKLADIHASKTIRGADCEQLRSAWQKLAFDRHGGAFCHEPVYGVRFFRGKTLLFETTICWKCQNFYVPTFDPQKKQLSHGWYGFANNQDAQRLFQLLSQHVPHPKL